jgi:hypothetical protein
MNDGEVAMNTTATLRRATYKTTSGKQDNKRRQSSDGVIGTMTMSDKDIDGCDGRATKTAT